MSWLFWVGLGLTFSAPLMLGSLLLGMYLHLCHKYLHFVSRIFQEKPLFIVPRGQPVDDAEDVRFPTMGGLSLAGCYLKGSVPRRGVILFGLEFGSNRWSCVPYCQDLLEAGFDVFAYEARNQGDSDSQEGYEPLQWVTDFDVQDAQAAIAYLKARPDSDPRGIGFFGISKGAGAVLQAAATEPYLRCFVTDGVFATYTTVVPYMLKWYSIYIKRSWLLGVGPVWFYGAIATRALREIEQERGCHFPHLEPALRRLGPRPWLLIHGAGDTYIKAEMAESLFALAKQPKEFWLVEKAKHNQALAIAGDEYRRRVREFLLKHLADPES